MAITNKQIQSLFTDIKNGKAALLLGQEYLKIDKDYYQNVLSELNIENERPSVDQLWKLYGSSYDTLSKALCNAAENSEYKPWLRSLLSLGWNIILFSSINGQWIKKGVGSNFSLIMETKEKLPDKLDFYKFFNKKHPHLVSLYSDEESIPDEKNLKKMKRNTSLINMIYDQLLSSYNGYLIVDGISEDDWFDIGRLTNNLDGLPYGCIYFFGMDQKRLCTLCDDEDNQDALLELVDDGHIILCEKSLKDTIVELGYVTDEEESEEEEDIENSVRISLSNDDILWVPRRECNRLNSINITLLRDEILAPLILTDENRERYFFEFLTQRNKKNWGFFDIFYKGKKMSFHVDRDVEGYMVNAVTNQLGLSNNKRELIVLKGNSNSGKTTSLSWLAWYAAKNGFKKKRNSTFVVLYIDGDPSQHDKEWQDILFEFIKNTIYDTDTVNGERIRNVIIIWDNYNGTDKAAEYNRLYGMLNECNAILIGSMYSFENSMIGSQVVQERGVNDLKPLRSDLSLSEFNRFKNLMRVVAPSMLPESPSKYLFEFIMDQAKYHRSPEWNQIKQAMQAGLSKEAFLTEKVSEELFNIFKNKNPSNFSDVKHTVQSLGIGAVTQSLYFMANSKKQRVNAPLINAIRDMNLILAVAGQFNKIIRLPISLLLKTVLNGKEYKGEHQKLNKILRTDSMVDYTTNAETGNIFVSFRHPSEADTYLTNTFGEDEDRKRQEVDVVIRVIKSCRWDEYEEARATVDLVRSFGTNSYRKYKDDRPIRRGQYNDYNKYWMKIADTLRDYASYNAEAMLVTGHFTRDHVNDPTAKDVDIAVLNEVLEDMVKTAKACQVKSTCSRLYGEICRNLSQQMAFTEDPEKREDLSYDFKFYFKLAVKNGKESKLSNNCFSMIQLIDIWLNYVLKYAENQDVLLPDTLEYIDLLFYNESTFIDDTEDYVNVISNINKIYEIIGEKKKDELKKVFDSAKNDSYVYCMTKQVLVRTYAKCKVEYPELFDNNYEKVVSSRVFFLNENAANDFEQFRSLKKNDFDSRKIFKEIKTMLKKASDEIIQILNEDYKHFEDMSFRCLLVYLKAKWMSYTDNLLFENNQRPSLSEAQWLELNNICSAIMASKSDNDVIPRSVSFIQSIYGFVFEKKSWEGYRHKEFESPNRLICLCDQTGTPRRFNVSVKPGTREKLVASIDYEVIDGKKNKGTRIVGQKNIYVPENIANYQDLRRSNLNINRDFVIWFNIGGPQIQDPEKEV